MAGASTPVLGMFAWPVQPELFNSAVLDAKDVVTDIRAALVAAFPSNTSSGNECVVWYVT